ncbi:MAG: hypothetical protein AB1797_04945 [bacterium]
MLDARCSILDAGKGSSIQDRASSIEFVPSDFSLPPIHLNSYRKSFIPQSKIRNPQ